MRPIVLVLALFACGKGQNPQPPADIQLHVQLQKAASCTALEENVHDTAVRQMRMQLDQQKSWNSGGVAATAGGAPAATPAPSSAPSSYTTTNTQVAGVDEADFVKNDGTRIFVLSGHRLFSATSWPAQSLAVKGKLDIEGWPSEMFLDGNQIAVFSSIWTTQPAAGMPCRLDGMGCFSGWSTTKVTVVDVSDLSAPKAVAAAEKILLRVRSCACVSMPTTTSQATRYLDSPRSSWQFPRRSMKRGSR